MIGSAVVDDVDVIVWVETVDVETVDVETVDVVVIVEDIVVGQGLHSHIPAPSLIRCRKS